MLRNITTGGKNVLILLIISIFLAIFNIIKEYSKTKEMKQKNDELAGHLSYR